MQLGLESLPPGEVIGPKTPPNGGLFCRGNFLISRLVNMQLGGGLKYF